MKDQTEIHRMAKSEEVKERRIAVYHLNKNFADILDKKEAWEDLIRLTSDDDEEVHWCARGALRSAFAYVPDKKQACEDMDRVPDEESEWADLIIQTFNNDNNVRRRAAYELGIAFANVSDKQYLWTDLHNLMSYDESNWRWQIADTLGIVFANVPDKKLAWDDLHSLTFDDDNEVLWHAAYALGIAFSHVPDKKLAWDDLHRLASGNDSGVRWGAAHAIGIAFANIQDKELAWDDLHSLTSDEYSQVRWHAAYALGIAFSHVPDKKLVWKDLHRLTSDTDSNVRASANYSLGKASIFKAANAENDIDLKKEMEVAIGYFEKSSQQGTWSKPAKFCLPFYLSFYTLIFKKEEAEAEVQEYIFEAKMAIEDSESKEKLLEAIENMGNALKEVQKAQDFSDIKADLNVYRRYCDRACELLETTDEKAPGASRLIRKGLPIIDKKIKDILAEIQEKARTLCKKTKETPLESLGIDTNNRAKQLSESEYLSLDIGLNKMIQLVKELSGYVPHEERQKIISELSTIENLEVAEKGEKISKFLDCFNKMDIPLIRNISIGKRKNEIIKIASVQLNFTLSTDYFPPQLYEKDKMKAKVIEVIRKASQNKVNILCLPELCICEDWLSELKKECGSMILIPGSYYDNLNHNLCPVICISVIDVPPQLKFYPSVFEDSKITGPRMVREKKSIHIYETEFGNFSVLICRDFGNFIPFLRGKVDMVFVPSYNSANERFHKEADNHVTNSPSYVIISNSAQFGGTSIFGQINRGYFPALVQKGYKKKGDNTYKLCEIEAKNEGIIIADLNLIYKYPPLQMPINPDEEIASVTNTSIIKL